MIPLGRGLQTVRLLAPRWAAWRTCYSVRKKSGLLNVVYRGSAPSSGFTVTPSGEGPVRAGPSYPRRKLLKRLGRLADGFPDYIRNRGKLEFV